MEINTKEAKSSSSSSPKKTQGHVLLLPYPSQGHINPMHQFAKRLVSKGLKATLIVTTFISKTTKLNPNSPIAVETISDGYDDTGFSGADSIHNYLKNLEVIGSLSLAELIKKLNNTNPHHPINCLVYDAFLPWALDLVVKSFEGIVTASFFTQACCVNSIYYHVQRGLLKFPTPHDDDDDDQPCVSVPGVPCLEPQDLPSFFYVPSEYPAYMELLVNQFSNVDKADWILMNTFKELEVEVVGWMETIFPLRTIGPTIPSMYLDKRIEDDKEYDINLYDVVDDAMCMNWLDQKPPGSVIYTSFGSMANLSIEQTEELSYALKQICNPKNNNNNNNNKYYFLWVVRTQSEQNKLPKDFQREMSQNGNLFIKWSPQLKVLAHEALGCFLTHCGWNSTLEALCIGVPMVGVPQWTDQPMDAKLVEDYWRVGLRARVDHHDEMRISRREEIERCVREVVEGERGREMKREALKWRSLAKEAVSVGGSTDRNIDEFIDKLVPHG
ncbi:hypothetical protein Scep_029254 [Stephania cephalantha]|uniref:Glycosyltransferase n=1 Tax=Stephania cephalantha TaxID=152367 RepID=A0AAP0HC25_9MAGN